MPSTNSFKSLDVNIRTFNTPPPQQCETVKYLRLTPSDCVMCNLTMSELATSPTSMSLVGSFEGSEDDILQVVWFSRQSESQCLARQKLPSDSVVPLNWASLESRNWLGAGDQCEAASIPLMTPRMSHEPQREDSSQPRRILH